MDNILFLTLTDIRDIYESGIYTDLIRELSCRKYNIWCISPTDEITKKKYKTIQYRTEQNNGCINIIKIKIRSVQKNSNLFVKGLETILLEHKIKAAVKKFLKKIDFRLILYSTPPITLVKPIKYIKNKNNCISYLMLKDIFPQNALDLKMLEKKGVKGYIYSFFKKKETALYKISDYIGCMSDANLDYILRNNKFIDRNRLEVFPNCIEIHNIELSECEKINIRKKYCIPLDKKIFIYGGNLGKPQSIPFMIDCIKSNNNPDVFFVVAGDGTEYSLLENFEKTNNCNNFKLLKRISRNDFDLLIKSSDVGLIFLDYRFSIPNFPSRLLSYMQASIPVLACTDCSSDVGDVIEKGKFGLSCYSNDVNCFQKCVNQLLECNLLELGNNARSYLLAHYNVKDNCEIILRKIKK